MTRTKRIERVRALEASLDIPESESNAESIVDSLWGKPMSDIESGDFVRDPMDGTLREVATVVDQTLEMVDGGVMGVEEVTEVLLPSEAFAEIHG